MAVRKVNIKDPLLLIIHEVVAMGIFSQYLNGTFYHINKVETNKVKKELYLIRQDNTI